MAAGHVQGGRLRRMAKLAGLAARTTADMVTARAMQAVAGTDEKALGEALRPTAERMVEVLGEMKGVATKLGQFLSVVDQDGFPEEAKQALQRLLHQAPRRLPAVEARAVIVAELGRPPEELFAAFATEPFAAASMGQVHAARLADGREVIVKIQFPGIDEAIEADLRNAGAMAKALSLGGAMLDGRGFLEEIAATLRRELDYGEEIKQLEEFRAVASAWPDLWIPDPVPALSTRRVLTLERLPGPTLLEFSRDPTRTAAERFRVARQLINASWGPFMATGLIHADPHPGNYIVCPDGRLGVLDFGATRWIPLDFAHAYGEILRRGLGGEDQRYVDALAHVGFVFRADAPTTEAWLQAIARIIERPLLSDHYDWETCRISSDLLRFKTRNPTFALMCRPPEASLMFYRSIAGVAGDLRILRAKGNFRQAMADMYATACAHRSPAMMALAAGDRR